MAIRRFLLQLSLCRGIGQVSKVRLWQAASQHRCFTDLAALAKWAQLGPNSQAAFLNNWNSEQLAAAVEYNRQFPFITIVDEEYPAQLRETFCPPLVLFYDGQLEMLKNPLLAVVGAREMSA